MVAGRLWPLWSVFYQDGMAQRRYLPYSRWPRRSRSRAIAFCTTQQLARQHKPRQSTPLVMANKTKKYGHKISWADLMILQAMWRWNQWAFKNIWFWRRKRRCVEPGAGCVGEPTANGSTMPNGIRANTIWSPLAAVQMGLIYVKPRRPQR